MQNQVTPDKANIDPGAIIWAIKCPLEDATYQTSKIYAIWFQQEYFLSFPKLEYKSM